MQELEGVQKPRSIQGLYQERNLLLWASQFDKVYSKLFAKASGELHIDVFFNEFNACTNNKTVILLLPLSLSTKKKKKKSAKWDELFGMLDEYKRYKQNKAKVVAKAAVTKSKAGTQQKTI